MKRPDFSKQAMQEFFLLHTEKVVFGICIALAGLFFWFGISKETYTDKNPSQLIELASQSNSYMNAESWEGEDKISAFRTGRSNAPDIIKNRVNVNATDYSIGAFRGTAAATKPPRVDPEIFEPIDMIASVFPATALITRNIEFPLDNLSPAPGPKVGAATDLGDSGDGGGAGGFGDNADGGFQDPGEDDPKPKRDDPNVVAIPELEYAKNTYLNVHAATTPGFNPVVGKLNANSTKARVFDVVSVRGLVNFKLQTKEFENAFESSIGYYPDRDRPIYQFLEVNRRELNVNGEPADGDAGKWKDISEDVAYTVPGFYPPMHKMPLGIFSSAPEVVAAENFDPLVTQPIPPFVMTDYRQHVTHPKLSKMRKFPEFDDAEAKTEEYSDDIDIFDRPAGSAPGTQGGGGGGKFSNGGGGAGAGMGAGGPGEGVGSGAGAGAGAGGFGAGAGAGAGASGPVVPDNDNYLRRGSIYEPYFEALDKRTPTEDYRLVRFFDFRAESGKSYEYRTRVWVGDPNNEDPQNRFITERGSLAAMGNDKGAGGMDPGSDPNSQDGGDDRDDGEGGDPAAGDSDGADPKGDKKQEKFDKIEIRPSMLESPVRFRINAAKDNMISTGGENPEMIKVPTPTENKKLTYGQYLRHARPSKWSETVKVQVKTRRTEVMAGNVVESKKFKISDTVTIFETEPAVEVVASMYSELLGTRVPGLKKVYRGDGLDFLAPAYLLHPVTRQVLVAQEGEGPGKYQFEFKTGLVLVDSIFGKELELPRAEKKRYATPTEMLVMDQYGGFHISNEMDKQTEYRNSLFLPDESKFVGRDRTKSKKKKKDTESGGKFGGGGGGAGAGAGGPGGGDFDF